MKLKFNEAETLVDYLKFVTEQQFIKVDVETFKVLAEIQRKTEIELNEFWKPLSELPPLQTRIIVQDLKTGEEKLMLRAELASSYSPELLVLLNIEEEESFSLLTKDYVWRLL